MGKRIDHFGSEFTGLNDQLDVDIGVGFIKHIEVPLKIRRNFSMLADYRDDLETVGMLILLDISYGFVEVCEIVPPGYLVEEYGSSFSRLEFAFLVPKCTGECTFDMAEQVAFQKVFLKCGTIDGNEGPSRSGAPVMNQSRQQPLAGAAFTANQNDLSI